VAKRVAAANVGIAVDVYHAWWAWTLYESLTRAQEKVLGYHLCDRLETTRRMLLDRSMMGDGVVNLRAIPTAVENGTGYTGMFEPELLSANNWWKHDPADVLDVILDRFRRLC